MSVFGRIFRVSTFGESHCVGVGCVIDGCPPNMKLTESDIQKQLTRRRPGQSRLSTPRSEADIVKIISGTEKGVTLGTPICLLVHNLDFRPNDYEEMSSIPRPGHADYTYQVKYGVRASSGGGRASARETIGRVASGAVAEKWLNDTYKTEIVSWVTSVGDIDIDPSGMLHPNDNRPWTREEVDTFGTLRILRNPKIWKKIQNENASSSSSTSSNGKVNPEQIKIDNQDEKIFVEEAKKGELLLPCYLSHDNKVYDAFGNLISGNIEPGLELWTTDELVPVRCPHVPTACKIATRIRIVKSLDDSIGGTVCCVISNVPVGLGEPCFDKLEALLAQAMLSLPATKGFEIGSGFNGTRLMGSQHNDPFSKHPNAGAPVLVPKTNNAGGTLGGISSGANILFRVAVKPVSTIGQAQPTTDYEGNDKILEAKGRHDPCVLPRIPPLIESMAALVLVDTSLIQRARVGPIHPSAANVDTIPATLQTVCWNDSEDGYIAHPSKRLRDE